jgi:Tfp pilus assembly protein PilF
MNLKRMDEAVQWFERAATNSIRRMPIPTPAVFNLAKCYEKKSMSKEANENYKRYISLVPTGLQSDEAGSKIKD